MARSRQESLPGIRRGGCPYGTDTRESWQTMTYAELMARKIAGWKPAASGQKPKRQTNPARAWGKAGDWSPWARAAGRNPPSRDRLRGSLDRAPWSARHA